MKERWIFLFFTAMVLCSSFSYASKLQIVSTIYPMSTIVSAVGGDRVEVKTIIPPGRSPHDYELRPSDIKKINAAQLIVVVGAHLDDWLEKALKRTNVPTFVFTEGIKLRKGNPHVWLDPLLVKERIPPLVVLLSQLDPQGASFYSKNGHRFAKKLEETTEQIQNILKHISCHYYMAQHDAWLYFGHRFGLTCLGVVEKVPGKEPGPRRLSSLVNLARSHSPILLFSERGENPRVMEVLARDANGILVQLDPLGDAKDSSRNNLTRLLLFNTRRIAHACAGR